ncbi:MAG: glycosyltransferase family 9 protein [Verrucomicrobia bacterium]|nr:glycosyltransferase family 9 protein [Verrucomicrobiota bacterium]
MQPRILVIRGGAIGDFILTLPAIRLLRENFPAAHLEILGYTHIAALAKGRFYADATRSIEYSALAGFFIPNSTLAPDLVDYFASFHQVVSYLFDPDLFFESNLRRAGVKNLLPAYSRPNPTEHIARQLAKPLQSLALFLDNPAPLLHPSTSDHAFAETFLGDSSAPLIAIHPGSGSPLKNWPLDNWKILFLWLLSLHPQPRILLVGGEADHPQLLFLSSLAPQSSCPLAKDLALPPLPPILSRATLFIGHDSGISHLAAATNCPCLLLFGPTDPNVWAPANPQVSILRSPNHLLFAISPTQVQSEVIRLLTKQPSLSSTPLSPNIPHFSSDRLP